MLQHHRLHKDKGKKKSKAPETEDEWLEAGVKEEEAGEKWRAGDSAKSARFFFRAVGLYEEGLQKHPASRVLAYNKARLQLNLCEQPRLIKHQPQKLFDLLTEALDSHRYALALQTDDPDTLYNTGQVMLSMVECLNAKKYSDGPPQDSVQVKRLLEEAIKIFQECLRLQSDIFTAQQEQAEDAFPATSDPDAMSVSPSAQQTSAESITEEKWALVTHPVTNTDLLDSCLAELEAWEGLIPLTVPDYESYVLSAHVIEAVMVRAAEFPQSTEQRILLDAACFRVEIELVEWKYEAGYSSVHEYAKAVSETWKKFPRLDTYGPALSDHANALISFSNTAVRENDPSIAELRWTALGAAAESLSLADRNPENCSRLAVNDRRGDIELLRARLADPPASYKQAIRNQDVLLKNAQTYYEGAWKLAAASTEEDESMADNILAKVVIVKGIREENLNKRLQSMELANSTRIRRIFNEMVEEGLTRA